MIPRRDGSQSRTRYLGRTLSGTWHNTLEPFFVKNLEMYKATRRDFHIQSTSMVLINRAPLCSVLGPIKCARPEIAVLTFCSAVPTRGHCVHVDAPGPDPNDRFPSGTQTAQELPGIAATGRLDSGMCHSRIVTATSSGSSGTACRQGY